VFRPTQNNGQHITTLAGVPSAIMACQEVTCAEPPLQAEFDPQKQLSLLLEFSDMLRLSLAGNLKDYEIVDRRGQLLCGNKVFYGAYPAAYAVNPWETVNYAACHDNETLFDQVTVTL
jgi:hypothetical protein